MHQVGEYHVSYSYDDTLLRKILRHSNFPSVENQRLNIGDFQKNS